MTKKTFDKYHKIDSTRPEELNHVLEALTTARKINNDPEKNTDPETI